jgi:Fe-S-cluster containining protein
VETIPLPVYQCDGCGACCRTKLVDVYEEDLLREPSLAQRMMTVKEPGLDGEIGYLNCLRDGACPFLDGEERCSIYPTRPVACVLFPPGGEECQEARKVFLLPPLEPIDPSAVSPNRSHPIFSSDTGEPIMANDAKKRPVHEVRLGRIKAAVWQNETENGTRHNVTISRLYRDGDKWKDTTSFGRDDLPLVGKVADMAHSWIFEQGASGGGESE